ncbi:hypothetical protein Gasu2_15540 [Galdieria sulphuraria]|uniref:Uncharacterized protein n=1 Tax=Galdieria sulphuraria TaxID=130081 RepID=M2XSW0_GALSU|nr:uncharacterized protein Gasu_58340 [Galdieria sulphuraria]EME26509.1 hypothetical protein Gasu_58340 [Galdieria sulphuraria]GJD07180.1 hypothetical protein Gasu2_15540 [Galdieria sulphuraria]|eukprot:XP_005703029.1 hypothetical protein Gasu_58340 [Galdieria sulphuraria]
MPYCRTFNICSPLVNRQEANYQVLHAFSDSYDTSDPRDSRNLRPVVCFSGHMYGSGKTTLGKRFQDFLMQNKEYISIKCKGLLFPGCCTSDEGLNAVYNDSLYVYVNLSDLPRTGEDFDCALHEFICKTALSEFLNSGELLSKVLPLVPRGPFEWLSK